ncbi:hypothetical protein [Parapedobacter sp.]
MKKIMITSSALLFACFFLISCQKQKMPLEAKSIDEAYKFIVGEWKWEKTESQARGQENPTVLTPHSENKTKLFIFKSDKSAVLIENGAEVDHYNFNIATSSQLTGTEHGKNELILQLVNSSDELETKAYFLAIQRNRMFMSDRLSTTISYYR